MPGKGGGHSLDAARRLFARRGDPCALCRGDLGPIHYRAKTLTDERTGRRIRDPLSLDVDHIVPTCDGGTDALSNLQATHHICNLRAGKKRRRYQPKQHSSSRPKPRTSRNWAQGG